VLRKAVAWIRPSNLQLLVIMAISLLAGAVVFVAGAYKTPTLILEARTLQQGQGTVSVEKNGTGGNISRSFAIKDDKGVKKMYVIELPAGSLKSIKLAPLASNGQFALDRIVLSNGTTGYFWDEQGQCSRQTLQPRILKSEACGSAAPVLTTGDDASVVISSIPDTEFVSPGRARIAAALMCAFGAFIGGIWLLRPAATGPATGLLQRYAVRSSWLVVALLYAYQLYLVSKYAVEIPYEDEWEYFNAACLTQDLPWRWLFSFHVEHRIVVTKMLAWLNLKLFGLDFIRQNILNMLMFGGLLAALVGFKNRVAGRDSFRLFPFFLVFLLSAINYENHLWAFQSQYHLVLLFSLAALCHAFCLKTTWRSAVIFSLYLVLAMYTFSAGVVIAVVYLFCITVYICAGIAGGWIERLPGWRFLLIVWPIIIAGLLLWSYGYVTPAWSPPKLYPTAFKFWDFYLNMISFGYGFDEMNMLPGLACLLVTTCPLLLLLYRKNSRWQPQTWQVLTGILAILAALAAVSVGRGNFGVKLSRHAEIGFMLIPYTALAWWLVVKDSGVRQKAILLLLWLFCFAAYFDNWSTQKYAEFKQINLLTLECVDAYYNGAGEGACQERTTFREIDRAKSMDVTFTRQFLSTRNGFTR
jgi:hypothetical protein